MKRLVAIVLSFMLVLVFGVTFPASAATSKSAPVTVRMVSWISETQQPDLVNYLKSQAAKYNIKLDYQYVDNNQYDNVINTQMAANAGPDILEEGGGFLGQAKAGYLMDLTKQPFVSKFLPNYIAGFTVGGKTFGVPSTSFFGGILYNKKIFSKYKIAVPKTWNDFLKIGAKLKGSKIKPFITGAKSIGTPMWPMFGVLNISFYNKSANKKFDENFSNQKATVDASWKATLQKYFAPMLTKGYYTKDMAGLDDAQAANEFALEKAAMMPGGTWYDVQLMKANPKLNYAIMPYPSLDGSTGWVVGAAGNCFSVNAQTKVKDASLKLINSLGTVDAQKALFKHDGGPSGLKGLNLKQSAKVAPCVPALKAGHIYATWVKWPYAGQILTDGTKELQMYISGTATLDDYLKTIDNTNKQTYDANN